MLYLISTLCKSFYLDVVFMEYIEKRLEGDIKYSGVIVNVRLDKAELINGDVVPAELPCCLWMRTAIVTWCASSAIPSSG